MSTQPPVPITGATLGKLFEFSYNVTKQNVDGFDEEDSLRPPREAGNHLNWVVGHVVAMRNHVLKLLGQKPPWSEREIAAYDRGSRPFADAWVGLSFRRILDDLDRTQETLRSALEALTPDALAAPLPPDQNPFGLDSLGEMLAAYSFHETYHAGQTGILRRVLGREGAIN
jgi:hypothetical protein